MSVVSHYVIVAAGGALGAMGRYGMVSWVNSLGAGRFPWGTWSVNVLGSLLLGMAFVLVMERLGGNAELRGLLMVGFLGAFTTFSTFSLETVQLLTEKAYGMALLYVSGSVLVCVAAAAAGVALGRYFLATTSI